MSDIRVTVGQNIRLFRKSKGITQEGLAEMVDVSGSYIGYLERGKKSPSLDLLAKIAEALEVNPALLLTSNDQLYCQELKKLVAILLDEGPQPIKFISKVAVAYLESINEFREQKKL